MCSITPHSSKLETVRKFNEHPLLISLVVHKIFQYLEPSADLNTLKNIRLVCTLWRDESLSWWRKTATLWLLPDCKNGNYYVQDPFTMLLDEPPPSADVSKQLAEKPFQKYKLANIYMDISVSLQNGTSSNSLWTLVGSHIKQLTVAQVQYSSQGSNHMQNISLFMELLSKYAPNLENLTITNSLCNTFDPLPPRRNHTRQLEQHFGVKYLRIKLHVEELALDHFPNLENLVLEKFNACDIALMLKQTNSNTQLGNINLKRLEILYPTDRYSARREYLNNLLGIRTFPKLEHIKVEFLKCLEDSPRMQFFRTFLEKHCTTNMKCLEILEWPFTSSFLYFPFDNGLEKVSELRLFGNVVHNLSFLTMTPNLNLLHMDLFGIETRKALKENENMWFAQDLRYFSANSLIEGVPQDVRILVEEESLEKLGSWMPNLKTLKTVLTSDLVPVISEQWPLLENLVGLLGSTVEDKDICNEEDKGLLELKCLKSFRLDTCCNEGLLTDWVVDSGLLKMHHLVDLQLCVSSQFSEDAEKRLKSHISTARVIRNYDENQQHINWECCQIMEFIHFFQKNLEQALKDKKTSE